MPSASASMLVAPKETPASTMNVLPSARTARPISPRSFLSPETASTWTTATCVMSGRSSRSMAISAAPAACSNPVSSFSNAMSARASMRQAASARAPLQTTSTRLSSGMSAKAQGPAIRTAAYSAGRMPATRRRRLRTSSIIEMNAASAGDGQQVMASRTDASMETGPGVSSRQALTCLFMIFNGRLFSQG